MKKEKKKETKGEMNVVKRWCGVATEAFTWEGCWDSWKCFGEKNFHEVCVVQRR
jgi:hypothetical protein